MKKNDLNDRRETNFLTIKDVSGYLQIHPITVYRLFKIGELPAFKVGGQWRCDKNKLDRHLEAQICDTF